MNAAAPSPVSESPPSILPYLLRACTPVVFLCSAAPLAVAQSRTLPELDSYIARAISAWHVPGLGIAIVKNGHVVFMKGYGVREIGKPDRVDSETMFPIASVTKSMTAAALGMLKDDGKLEWDDKVQKFLPEFQLADPFATRELTIRDLLTHRAGLEYNDIPWFYSKDPEREVIRKARFIPNAYSFRSRTEYQSVMYAAAGPITATAAGMPWDQFITQRLFVPLHMSRTVALRSMVGKQGNMTSAHVLDHDTARVVATTDFDNIRAAGSIWSTASDMAKWMVFLLDSGQVDGKQLLQKATLAELLSPQSMISDGYWDPSFFPLANETRPHWLTYGLGWAQEDYAGRQVDFHIGNADGVSAIVGIIPDERLGVFIVDNVYHSLLRHALMYEVFDLFLHVPPQDWSEILLAKHRKWDAQSDSSARKLAERRIPGTHPSLSLDRYTGTYRDSLVGDVTVSLVNGSLRMCTGGQYCGTLEHWHHDLFRIHWDVWWDESPFVSFTIGARGLVWRAELWGRSLTRVASSK
jgi:CubicO group peptidase (beta-lactamase class C family)